MSLINDALKQAKQTQQENPPPTPPLQFQPAAPAPPNPARDPILLVGLVLALILVVALGGLAVRFVAQQSASELRVAAKTVNEPAPAVPAAPLPVEPETNTLPVTVIEPPMPQLHGISFHPTRPLAIVNGKNVVIGDRVEGFRVLAITRRSVTLGSATATNVLSLSE